jgi:hypothetical protein
MGYALRVRTIQGLLAFGVLSWAVAPMWGGYAFGAVYLLTLLTLVLRRRAAGKKLGGHAGELSKSLPPEAVEWAQRYPLFYVWPEAAKSWALTMTLISLAMVGLSLLFVARGLFFVQPGVWVAVAPAAGVFFVSGVMARGLDLDELVGRVGQRATHDEVKRVLTMQSHAGTWSPGEPG